MLFTCYRFFCPTQKKRLILKAIGLEPSLVSDVRCVPLCSRNFDSHQRCSFKMQKTRNFSKSIKDFSKQRLHVAYEDERTSLDHSGTHLTSPAEFGSSPFQDGGNEFILHKLNVPFRTKKIDNNETTYTFLNHHSNTSILQNYFFSVHPLY